MRRAMSRPGLVSSLSLVLLVAGCDEKLSDIAGPSPGLTRPRRLRTTPAANGQPVDQGKRL